MLCLIEAKHWSKPVGVASILVLASRIADIQVKEPSKKIHASIVSTQKATRGANQLAPHFDISIDVVSNEHEYVLRLVNHVFVGVQGTVAFGDFVDAEIIPAHRARKSLTKT